MAKSSKQPTPSHKRGDCQGSSSTSPPRNSTAQHALTTTPNKTPGRNLSNGSTTSGSNTDNSNMPSPIGKLAKKTPRRPSTTSSSKPSKSPIGKASSGTQPLQTQQQQQQQQQQQVKNNDNKKSPSSKEDAVPHVVRVTLLGVAGILTKPCTNNATTAHAPSVAGTQQPPQQPAQNNATIIPPIGFTNDSQHPSLLFPIPTRMRVVATVSRTRTARGIPSGMSKCLFSSRPSPPPVTATAVAAISHSAQTSTTSSTNNNNNNNKDNNITTTTIPSTTNLTINTNTRNIKRDPSTGLELFENDSVATSVATRSIISTAQTTTTTTTTTKTNAPNGEQGPIPKSGSIASGVSPAAAAAAVDTPCPPSQLLHGRTGSSNLSNRTYATAAKTIQSGSYSMELDEKEESIEIIRPSFSMEGGDDIGATEGAEGAERGAGQTEQHGDKFPMQTGKSAGVNDSVERKESTGGGDALDNTGGSAIVTTASTASSKKEEDGDSTASNTPERFIAIWEEEMGIAKSLSPRAFSPKSALPATAGGQGNAIPGDGGKDNNNASANANLQYVNYTNILAFEAELRPSSTPQTAASGGGGGGQKQTTTPFAPKTFCITIGLVPDFEPIEDSANTGAASGEGTDASLSTTGEQPQPTFAIPVGLANLVITGQETLDGKSVQVDLPLASLSHFVGSFGGENAAAATAFPLMELTAIDATGDSNKDDKATDDSNTTEKKKSKPKKKSIVSRMFSRSKQPKQMVEGAPKEEISVYSGDPQSIFNLGRPPNALERTLFLERYGIDPSGDAVVRIGLEVFPRGSELEKNFRQKQKLRREQRKKAAAVEARRVASPGRSVKQCYVGDDTMKGSRSFDATSRISSTGTGSPSLVDDEEELLDSDSDSEYSRSFFSLGSDISGSTWEESTLSTDGGDTFYSSFSMADSYMTATQYRSASNPQQNVFGRVFDCNAEGVESEDLSPRNIKSKKGLATLMGMMNCQGSSYDNDVEDDRILYVQSAASESIASDSTPIAKQRGTTSGVSVKNERKPKEGMVFEIPVPEVSMTERISTDREEPSPLATIKQCKPHAFPTFEETNEKSCNHDSTASVSNEQTEGHEMTLEELSKH